MTPDDHKVNQARISNLSRAINNLVSAHSELRAFGGFSAQVNRIIAGLVLVRHELHSNTNDALYSARQKLKENGLSDRDIEICISTIYGD